MKLPDNNKRRIQFSDGKHYYNPLTVSYFWFLEWKRSGLKVWK